MVEKTKMVVGFSPPTTICQRWLVRSAITDDPRKSEPAFHQADGIRLESLI